MQADRSDRYDTGNGGRKAGGRHGTQTLLTAIAVIILAGGAYLLAPGDDEDSEPATDVVQEPNDLLETVVAPPRPEPEAAIAAAPDIPEQAPEPVEDVAEVEEEAPPPPPPTPEEIDAMLREGVAESGLSLDPSLDSAYAAPYILDRGMSSVDQMARGLVPLRSLNLGRPDGDFAVTREGQRRFVDPSGYRRYDTLVNAITDIPTDDLATLFHRFREELTEAYSALGYPAEKMDNTVIAALDQILSAPTVREPIELREKGALYVYADEGLESASDLHKQLLRTGPDNTERLKRWARDLRAALLR